MTEHDRTILHEEDVREVIQDEIENTVGANQTSIDPLDPVVLSETYSYEELAMVLNDIVVKVNQLIGTLENAGIINMPE